MLESSYVKVIKMLKRTLLSLLLFAAPAYAQQAPLAAAITSLAGAPIAVLKSANFNTTADQAMPIYAGINKYVLDSVRVTNCTASLTLAAGGIYTAASKGGTAVVAAAQLYSAVTGATDALALTIATAATAFTANPLYLALTTAQGGAATCDVYIYGRAMP